MSDHFESRQSTPRKETPKVRQDPRITIHALAEYLTSAAVRRRRIISEQKKPKDFQVIYYRETEDAIAECLSGSGDERPLNAAVRTLRGGAPEKWEASRRKTGQEGIEVFRAWLPTVLKELDLGGVQLAGSRPGPLMVGRLAVSARPELLLLANDGKVVGGIKLYFRKGAPLSKERAEYAGRSSTSTCRTRWGLDSAQTGAGATCWTSLRSGSGTPPRPTAGAARRSRRRARRSRLGGRASETHKGEGVSSNPPRSLTARLLEAQSEHAVRRFDRGGLDRMAAQV